MAQIRWSDNCLEDLRAISDYISKDSPRYADSIINEIFERAELLAELPRIGRVVPEFEIELP